MRLNKIMFNLLTISKCLQLNCYPIQQLLAIVKDNMINNLFYFYFIYSFFNVENYGKNTVYNKNNSEMLIDVNTLVKKRKQNC